MLTLLSDWCLANSTLMSATLTAVAQIFATVKRHSAYADVHTICDEYLLKVRAAGSAAAAAESKEECLACRGAIVFMSPWKAVCANGHPWDRCAVSLLTAATPKTRSCLGCNRKSISPEALATGDETAADAMPVDGTVVESNLMKVLLESMAVCVYCGNQLRS
ncbi:putative zinc-finger of transcription factor IIIC complex-domain-containing protein [Chytriomyces sp. MP71]|nr:putative zinc-finger of transcription factor IIIC complex-domain-containing protein [Chytriomyces sp. MP71]